VLNAHNWRERLAARLRVIRLARDSSTVWRAASNNSLVIPDRVQSMLSRFALVVLIVVLAGCSNKELPELKARVLRLEQELATSQAKLAARDGSLVELNTRLAQTEAELRIQTDKQVRLKIERDKLLKDNHVLRKRCNL